MMDPASGASDEVAKALERRTGELLSAAATRASRRGSTTIREVDALGAIEDLRAADDPLWYRVPVRGDGNCLFTALRLLLEVQHVVASVDAGAPPGACVVDGDCSVMVTAAFKLRGAVIEWFRRRLHSEVPELGEYTQGGRLWRRGDLLALEMVRKSIAVPESDGPAREAAMLKYLLDMSRPAVWGSTPEYTAVALMSGKCVRVHTHDACGVLRIFNAVNEPAVVEPASPPAQLPVVQLASNLEDAQVFSPSSSAADNDDQISSSETSHRECQTIDNRERTLNLHFHGNHYEALVTSRQRHILAATYGDVFVRHFTPVFK